MLVLPPAYGSTHQSNLTAASRAGTTVTASATPHTKGSYATLIDPTSFPSYGVYVVFRNVSVTATATKLLVDIAYGPTGSTPDQVVIPNLNACAAGTSVTNSGARGYFFPVYIPTGVRVGARCQALAVSDTVEVSIWLVQRPLYENACGNVTAYGVVAASSRGTLVTAGAGAFGTWTSLGSLTKKHKYWTAGIDMGDDTTMADSVYNILEIGVGPDSSNVSVIHGPVQTQEEGTEILSSAEGPVISYNPTPASGSVWARTAATAAEIRGVIAYGMD